MSRRLAIYETDAVRIPTTTYAPEPHAPMSDETGHAIERILEERRELVVSDSDPDEYETDEDAWNEVDMDDDDYDSSHSDHDSPVLHPAADVSTTRTYSPTSFLQPGVLFTGKQIFEPSNFSRRPIPSTSVLPPAHSPHTDSLFSMAGELYDQRSQRIFADYPSSATGTASADTSTARLAIARAALVSAEDNQGVSQSTVARLRSQVRLLEVRNRLDMLSATAENTSVDESERNEMLEMRALYLETLVHGASTQSAGSPLTRTLGAPTLAPFRRRSVAEEESDNTAWDLKVYITTNPKKTPDSPFYEFDGIMSAYGVPCLSSPCPLVTTAFTGEIIDIRRRGLWSAKKWRARREDDLEHWGQLGPFKELEYEELRKKCDDFDWVEEIAENWILMRWKESAFVNVERQSFILDHTSPSSRRLRCVLSVVADL